VYYRVVTSNQLKRWLAGRGCTFEEGSKHIRVFYRGRATLLPRHGSKELPTGTVEGIKKELGLK
jgi:mRNA interferase HicA